MGISFKLEGVIPAIVTPFDENGNIDESSLRIQTEYLVSGGVNGLFVNGTTGEGAYLDISEKIKKYNIIKDVAKDRVFIGFAILSPTTNKVIREIEEIKSAGISPDFIAAVPPFYCKYSQDAIYKHYMEIIKKSPFPVVLYNIPQCTGNQVILDIIEKLSETDRVIGIKDSSGDFINFLDGIGRVYRDNFSWIQGHDKLYAYSFIAGAAGIVTGLGNIFIDPFIKMYRAAVTKDYSSVLERQKTVNVLFKIIDVTGGKVLPSIKFAISLTGRCKPFLKDRYSELSNDEREKVRQIIESLKIL